MYGDCQLNEPQAQEIMSVHYDFIYKDQHDHQTSLNVYSLVASIPS